MFFKSKTIVITFSETVTPAEELEHISECLVQLAFSNECTQSKADTTP